MQGEAKMGNAYAEITLKNLSDLIMAEKGHLMKDSVRETTVNAMVDTGAWTLAINEAVREKLGLEVRSEDWVTLANGAEEMVKKVEPVEVQWKDRTMTCQPILFPGTDEVLLGAIPLEDLNLFVDPKNQELVGRKKGDKTYRRL